jgi:hypothetical protein
MPAPTTQTSAVVFLSNVDDRMIEAVATQTEGVLRRLDSRFRAVLLLERRLEVFFVMIGNRLRERASYQGANSENVGNLVTHAHLAAGAASKVGQTAKARSGYRVQSLPKGRDRQRRTILSIAVPLEWSKVHDSSTVRKFSDVDQVLKIA